MAQSCQMKCSVNINSYYSCCCCYYCLTIIIIVIHSLWHGSQWFPHASFHAFVSFFSVKCWMYLMVCFSLTEYRESNGIWWDTEDQDSDLASTLTLSVTSSCPLGCSEENSHQTPRCSAEGSRWQGADGIPDQQPMRKSILLISMWVSLEADPPQSSLQISMQLWLILWFQTIAFLIHRNYDVINVCCFKSLAFHVIC